MSDFENMPSDYLPLCFEILMNMEVAALRRTGPKTYSICGMAPAFYTQFFPQDESGYHCSAPWQFSPMLELFLEEAEDFFQQDPAPGATLSSGIWVEESDNGEELPLTATAMVLKNNKVMLICAAREKHAEQIKIPPHNRAELLERRKFANALNFFKKRALYDHLTKVYNHGSFMEILQNQITALRTYAPNLALLMMAVDDFKNINDNYDHIAGDSVLTQIGGLLRRSLRKNDAPAHYGGEKFAVIAPNTTLPQSGQVAEKLRAIVANHDFGTGRQVTISIGATIYRPGEDSRDFISRADLALYDAKHGGQNTVCLRDPWT